MKTIEFYLTLPYDPENLEKYKGFAKFGMTSVDIDGRAKQNGDDYKVEMIPFSDTDGIVYKFPVVTVEDTDNDKYDQMFLKKLRGSGHYRLSIGDTTAYEEIHKLFYTSARRGRKYNEWVMYKSNKDLVRFVEDMRLVINSTDSVVSIDNRPVKPVRKKCVCRFADGIGMNILRNADRDLRSPFNDTEKTTVGNGKTAHEISNPERIFNIDNPNGSKYKGLCVIAPYDAELATAMFDIFWNVNCCRFGNDAVMAEKYVNLFCNKLRVYNTNVNTDLHEKLHDHIYKIFKGNFPKSDTGLETAADTLTDGKHIMEWFDMRFVFSKGMRNERLLEVMAKNNTGKFDAVVMNPPYDGTLYQKFFKAGIEMTNDKGICVCVSPAAWIISKKQAKNVTELCDKYKTVIRLLSQYDTNEMFPDAEIGSHLSVTWVDKSVQALSNPDKKLITYIHREDVFDKKRQTRILSGDFVKCADINFRQINDDKLASIYKKLDLCSHMFLTDDYDDFIFTNDNIDRHVKKMKGAKGFPQAGHELFSDIDKDKYVYNVRCLYGHDGKADFYTIHTNLPQSERIGLYSEFIKKTMKDTNNCNENGDPVIKQKLQYGWVFDSSNQAKRFDNYLSTYFVRILLYKTKNGRSLDRGEMTIIPWPNLNCPVFDGTPEQIDNKLFEIANLTKIEIDRIHEILPDYYGERYKKGCDYNGQNNDIIK